MLLELENKVVDFLKEIEFPVSKVNILLAVSGGADSVALLYALHAITSQNILPSNLFCAHINHQLRTDADNDEEFVISQAQKLNIPIITKRLNVEEFSRDKKLSIETAARQLRIENLSEIAKANNCNWIATGHQKNDNAETILHRMLRGTGFRGLAGIWPIRKFNENIMFVRPLLCVTRDEITQYLKQKNLDWHEDYTNAEFKYTRNHIRHRLLPALQKQSKNPLVEQLAELSSKAEIYYKQIIAKVDISWPDVSERGDKIISLKRERLLSLLPSVQIELIRRALIGTGSGERDLTSEHYERILELVQQGHTGKTIQLPNGFNVQVEYEHLVFKTRRVGFIPPSSSYSKCSQNTNLIIPGKTILNEFSIYASVVQKNEVDLKNFLRTKTPEIEWFDFDKIKPPLFIRYRKEGDRFIPFGQKVEKKIGKFITAQRVPEEMRNNSLVIEDSEKIIWLYPIRTCEQTKITSKTKNILQLEIRNIKSD